MYRLAWLAPIFVLISIACGANAQTELRDSAKLSDDPISRLRVAVDTVFGAALDRMDVEKLADATHPRALKAAGGREEYTRVMKEALELSKAQFQKVTYRFSEPKLYELQGTLIGVVPRTLDGMTVTKNSIVTNGTVVGISEDDGKTWMFINGQGFPKQFPEFVDVVVIPKEKTFINGVEQ